MENAGLFLLAVVTLAAAVYAQYRLPCHTAVRWHWWVSRTILVVLGLLFGWVTSSRYPVEGLTQLLVFLSAFGVVHVPAAAILFIKRKRGEWQ
jgi:uncharacterized membrane protein YfcA